MRYVFFSKKTSEKLTIILAYDNLNSALIRQYKSINQVRSLDIRRFDHLPDASKRQNSTNFLVRFLNIKL